MVLERARPIGRLRRRIAQPLLDDADLADGVGGQMRRALPPLAPAKRLSIGPGGGRYVARLPEVVADGNPDQGELACDLDRRSGRARGLENRSASRWCWSAGAGSPRAATTEPMRAMSRAPASGSAASGDRAARWRSSRACSRLVSALPDLPPLGQPGIPWISATRS